ncbi:MAG: RnfH family protein [Comamonadaceae bacterium]|nr:MAG: RnfH family protein [Comamonadaceae bacterium]
MGPGQVDEEVLQLREGSTLRDAVMASGLRGRHALLDWEALTPGIWGRPMPWTQHLAAGDRIELCRPLLVDPKVARRERFRQQGRRSTGLFARSRPGGKAGY